MQTRLPTEPRFFCARSAPLRADQLVDLVRQVLHLPLLVAGVCHNAQQRREVRPLQRPGEGEEGVVMEPKISRAPPCHPPQTLTSSRASKHIMAYELQLPPNSEEGFKEAERRIDKWKERGEPSETLDLAVLRLTTLPDSLWSLHGLQHLDLVGNNLSTLSEHFGNLRALQLLSLQENRLVALPEGFGNLKSLRHLDLRANQLGVLPESFGQLKSLQELDLSANQLCVLPESFGNLHALYHLSLGSNQLYALPESIGSLQALQLLDLRSNQLGALPESMGKLHALQGLYLQRNQLSTLPESLGNLQALEELDLSGNHLSTLPKSLKHLINLEALYLHGNSKLELSDAALGPSWEDVENRNERPEEPMTILTFYFERQQQGERPLNEVKLMLVGRGEAGKTSVSRALRGEAFDKEQRETPGIEIKDWKLVCPGGDPVTVHLWDLAGQEITHETHRYFLTERSLYLVVLDGRSGQQMEDADYWLKHVKQYGSKGDEVSPVIVVLNKWESPGPYEVEKRRLQREFPNIRAFVNTDCATDHGIAALRETISDVLGQMPAVRQKWPNTYARVRQKLEEMVNDADPTKRRHFLTWADYQKVCKDCGVAEEHRQHALAETLNALGLALYYGKDDRLRDTRVLNPNWAANGLYGLVRGVNAKPYQGKRGHLWAGDMRDVLAAGMNGMDKVRGATIDHYPEERDGVKVHEFLLDLMVDRELGFEAGSEKGKPVYLLPGLLSLDEPEVKDFDVAAHIDKAELRFRYIYELLPAGIMSRLIVRTHTLSENLYRWQRGVVLEWGQARALVMAEKRRNPRVDVFIAGGTAEERQELAGVVRSNMEAIHDGLPDGLTGREELDLTVPGEQYEDVQKLKRLEEAKMPIQIVTSSGPEEVPVTPELEQVEPAGARQPDAPKLRVFVSYSHKDYKVWDQFRHYLDVLKNRGEVEWWFDGKIREGTDWDNSIRTELREADIVVLLISTPFFSSGYIQGVELAEAKRKLEAKEAGILPVLLEKCAEFEEHEWLSNLQASPSVEGKLRPMNSFNPRSNGWHEVDKPLRRMIRDMAKAKKRIPMFTHYRLGGRVASANLSYIEGPEPPLAP